MPLIQSSYLQKAWGEAIDNISLDDVKIAIQETIVMDDEHGAFWVSIGDDETYILETHKDLLVIGIFNNGKEIKKQFKDWTEIESLYTLLLDGAFNEVELVLSTKY